MQDICEKEFLVLLLVVQPDLQDTHHLGELRLFGARQQPLDSRIDVGAKRRDALAVRPREEAAPWPRVARASRDIVRIEKVGELRVEDAIAGKMRDEKELLEEPGRVRPVPLGRARIRHRLHYLVLSAQRSGAALGLRPHSAEGVEPEQTRIVRRGVGERWEITFVTAATRDR